MWWIRFIALLMLPALCAGIVLSASPTVSLTFPPNNPSGLFYATNSNIYLAATASESGATISYVQFYENGTAVGPQCSNSPYCYTWNDVTSTGTYSLTAKAVDANNNSTTSSVVSLTVNSPGNVNTTFKSPTNNSTVPAGNISLVATATSYVPEGSTISSVQFYQGNTPLGSSSTSPYSYLWSNVAAGSYTLTTLGT